METTEFNSGPRSGDMSDSISTDSNIVESPSGVVPTVSHVPSKGRPMQKARFLFGMLLSGSGIALMLAVAAGVIQFFGLNGRLSLPAVGLCMIIGLMLLGGGFGIMATASPTFDDDEFERLMREGDASLPGPVVRSDIDDIPAFRSDAERSTEEHRTLSEQSVA